MKQHARMNQFVTSVCLLIVAFLAYGLTLNRLGFYWDDLPVSWIYSQFGPKGLAEYFFTNRPVWGVLFQLTNRYIPQQPIYWQLFALLLRWLSAVLFYKLMSHAFPNQAFITSLFFLVYPGFNGQPVAYLFSRFYIVICFFLLSLLLIFKENWKWNMVALIFSALNLWMLEYFFMLELIRPFFIWLILKNRSGTANQRRRRFFEMWMPFLIIFIASVLSRVFVFNNQTYKFKLFQQFMIHPAKTTIVLLRTVIMDVWIVSATAWVQVFRALHLDSESYQANIVYFVVILIAFLILYALFTLQSQGASSNNKELIYFGIAAVLLGGIPFWITNIPVSLVFPANRTTLPFMFGVSMLLAALVYCLPGRGRILVASLVIGFATANHFSWTKAYVQDWEDQKNFFWQLTWRAPALHPGTTILLNDRALYFTDSHGLIDLVDTRVLPFEADNSLSASLNWIYSSTPAADKIPYLLLYPKSRLGGSLPVLEGDFPIRYKFFPGHTFKGTTSQIVALYYAPPGCLRVLDPEIDADNQLIPHETLLQEAVNLSSSQWIEFQDSHRLPNFYGVEPDPDWCFYFEKAELARQQKNWSRVVELGEIAFSLPRTSIAPLERFVFIEGYAHLNDWQSAVKLSQEEFAMSPSYSGPLLCRLWDRIQRDVEDNSIKERAISTITTDFDCVQ